jgi:pimeloyl-ACP methyl ester carboxylesterase
MKLRPGAGTRSLAPALALLVLLPCLACQNGTESPRQTLTGTATSADGLAINYTVAGTGSPAIVLVHCWSCDASYWDAQVEHFRSRNKVVTIDLAGHGNSAMDRDAWTIEGFAGDVVAVVEQLDLHQVVLVGHSMGGPVVVEAALRMPERVIGIVGVDNFQRLDIQFTDEQLGGFLGPFRSDFRGATAGFVTGMFPPGVDSTLVSAIADDMAAAPPEVGLAALENLMRWTRDDAKASLGKLQIPMRCIVSEMRPVDLDGNRQVIDDFDIEVMTGVGHFPMREDPDRFNEILGKVVDGFTKGGASG